MALSASSSAPGQKDVDSILVSIQMMWEHVEITAAFGSDFPILQVCQSPSRSAFLLPSRESKPLKSRHRRGLFQGMAQEVSVLKGQDDQDYIDELKLQMNTVCETLEFDAVVPRSDPGHRDPADQTAGHGCRICEPMGCLWLLRGRRAGCVQVFFVRRAN